MNRRGSAKALSVVGICVAVIVVFVGSMWLGFHNREVGLRNRFNAQQKVCMAVYDQTWKVISQKAQVTNEYKNAFKEIFPELMEGRYGNARGGALLSFIHESNPDFNVALFQDLATAIEAQRVAFTREQKMLLDIKREHNDILFKAPSSLFVGGRPELVAKIVTSEKTERTYETGREDDVDVFRR